jgi:hypothetical protein
MPTQRYEVTQPHVNTLLAWVASGALAIPEIQRPFVRQATDVRDLLHEAEVDSVNFVTRGTAKSHEPSSQFRSRKLSQPHLASRPDRG